ncbi:hypothetical protein [Saezia sanguinis]|uniref:hypothetical protein n=1 Tax=Saezia sanguinis TaxID=1965230 RepID=UPI003022F113
MIKVKIALACLSALFLQAAVGQTLAERAIHQKQEELLAPDIKRLHENCGADIKVSFDWSTFNLEELEKYGAYSLCQEAVRGVNQICLNSEIGKQTVQAHVKSIVCSRTTPKLLEFANGTLRYGMEYGAQADLAHDVQKYLEGKL